MASLIGLIVGIAIGALVFMAMCKIDGNENNW